VAAQAFFAKDSTDYILYLCVHRITLDHNQIEGVGISPDIELPFKAIGSYGDNQIEKALDVLAQPKS
jgi:C-terminal processing protease CtpA/Prc